MLGTLVRMVALFVPVAASVAAAAVLSRLVPRPSGLFRTAGWWLMIAVVSTLVLAAVDRAARRLLPLAALLRLSLLFPDRAPSRFWIAFRAGTTCDLRAQLARAKQHGIDDEPARAAERILELVAAMSRHDRATRGHSERVRAFSDLIVEELRLPQADRDRLRWAALLHDIGKLNVPPRLLNKPDHPNYSEWDTLRRHPEDGARIAAPLAGWLSPWAPAIEEHHERFDGTGYPRGLAGEEINFGARIVAVADVFEVMTAPRAYRRPVSAQAARRELATCAGSQFDAAVVRAFLNVSLGRLRMVMGPISWLAQLPFLGAMPRLEEAAAVGRSAVTAAGAATGVSALAMMGVVGSPHADHGPRSSPGRSSPPAAQAGPATLHPSGGPAEAGPSGGSAAPPQASSSHPRAGEPPPGRRHGASPPGKQLGSARLNPGQLSHADTVSARTEVDDVVEARVTATRDAKVATRVAVSPASLSDRPKKR